MYLDEIPVQGRGARISALAGGRLGTGASASASRSASTIELEIADREQARKPA